VYRSIVTDAKRTPYRRAEPPAPASARGTLVSRPDDEARERPRPEASRNEPADPDRGVFSGLVSPHPASTPAEWWAQAALTLIGLPVWAFTFVLVGWLDTRRAYDEVVRQRGTASRPVGIAHPLAWIFGSIALGAAGVLTRVPPVVVGIVIVIALMALFARRALRSAIVERETLLARRRKR
jgi:hypothetical protein